MVPHTPTKQYVVIDAIIPPQEERTRRLLDFHQEVESSGIGEIVNRYGRRDWELHHRLYQAVITLDHTVTPEQARDWLLYIAPAYELQTPRVLTGYEAEKKATMIRRSTALFPA